MSLWQRWFGKRREGHAAPAAGLQPYREKYSKYQELLLITAKLRQLTERLRHVLRDASGPGAAAVRDICHELLQNLEQAMTLLQTFCRRPPEALLQAGAAIMNHLQQVLAAAAADVLPPEVQGRLQEVLAHLLCPPPLAADSNAGCVSLPDLVEALTEARLEEMFCLSLRTQVSKKQASSLVTGRLVPILVVDVDGGLSRHESTVGLADVASVPFQAFLQGMLSIPWPKARPVDMKGFISVVGVTSTTPRAEDQLQKISLAILARQYMNFSLCLGYHASTIEAYVADEAAENYLRFHYQGGAASLERRVRRLKLISGILTRLGFTVGITGDLLDGRKHGNTLPECLRLLEILGRLEVFTKQMDMVMSSDEVIYGYIEEFLTKHC